MFRARTCAAPKCRAQPRPWHLQGSGQTATCFWPTGRQSETLWQATCAVATPALLPWAAASRAVEYATCKLQKPGRPMGRGSALGTCREWRQRQRRQAPLLALAPLQQSGQLSCASVESSCGGAAWSVAARRKCMPPKRTEDAGTRGGKGGGSKQAKNNAYKNVCKKSIKKIK